MGFVYIGIAVGILAVTIAFVIAFIIIRNKPPKPAVELDDIETLAAYVKAQKETAEAEARLKVLKQSEMKQKLEVFKQTKEQLATKLRTQIDAKDWGSLDSVLTSADKGGVGIYVLYNETRGKYYVGQAKQLHKRVRDHFNVETMARDFLGGDVFHVKFLTANELDADYRLDHIEKTAIEVFGGDGKSYNKTTGNL